jgi:hypothetical protein
MALAFDGCTPEDAHGRLMRVRDYFFVEYVAGFWTDHPFCLFFIPGRKGGDGGGRKGDGGDRIEPKPTSPRSFSTGLWKARPAIFFKDTQMTFFLLTVAAIVSSLGGAGCQP